MRTHTRNTDLIDQFREYLDRLDYAYEEDPENSAIDIELETREGDEYTVTLVAARRSYTLFVSPLAEVDDSCATEELYRRLLELADQCRYVTFSIDADGDIKLATEGFSRLDGFRQFRRRMEAIEWTLENHGPEILDLAQEA
jgi:hypothetical protein